MFGEEFERLNDAICDMGFDGVLYSFYPKPMYLHEHAQPLLHYSQSYSAFTNHYIANNYGNRDFVLRLAFNGNNVWIDWWDEIEKGNVTKEEQEVTEDARKNFNIHHGLSIPLLDGTYAIAGISVISMNPDKKVFAQLKEKHIEDLRKAATSYHSAILHSKKELCFFVRPLLDNLSPPKKKVLKHLMRGEPLKMIEHREAISRRYAEKTLLTIRREFGNISTNELMYILGMLNVQEIL